MKLFRKPSAEEVRGFLEAETNFTGELYFSGTLRLEGNLHGSIVTPDILVIGQQATVNADIKAGEVHVHGSVSGTIRCERRLQVYPTGRLKGEVLTPTLIIEEGATFEGLSRPAVSEDEPESINTPSE